MQHQKITNEALTYKANTLTLYGTLYYPTGFKDPLPGLILFPTWMGRDAFSEEKGQELAKQGYVVLVADPYGETQPAENEKQAGERMTPLFMNRLSLQARARAAFDALLSKPQVHRDKIGALGFCFGGLMALELLYQGAPVKGIVSLHGVLTDHKGGKQVEIGVRHQNLSGKSALILHGNDDPLVSQEDLTALRKTLTDSQVEWTLTIYGHASHAFTNPKAANHQAGLVYNAHVATRAWHATLDFFNVLFTKMAQ